MQSAQAGDRAAFDTLLTRYLPWVRQTVMLHLGRPLRCSEDLDDIVQESMLDAFRGLGRFQDRGDGGFRHWMVSVVTNNVRDALRKSRRAPRQRHEPANNSDGVPAIASTAGRASPCQEAQAAELEQRLETALWRLSATHREVIVMRDRCGLGYDAIARQLGFKNADTARALHHRALRKLEQLLVAAGRD